MGTTESSLEERIVHLERRNRRMQNGMLGLALIAVLPWTFAAKNHVLAGVVEASEIRLMNGASLVTSIKPVRGGVGFFSDDDKIDVAITHASTLGGTLRTYAANGEPTVEIAGGSADWDRVYGHVDVISRGSVGASLAATPDGSGSVRVVNSSGKSAAWLFATARGGRLDLSSSDGVPVLKAGSDGRGGYVALQNASHVQVGLWAMTSSGYPQLELDDPITDKRVLGLYVAPDNGGLLQVFSTNGLLLTQVPDR